MNIEQPETVKRSCLKCNKLFESISSGNRLCYECKRVNERVKNVTKASNFRRGLADDRD
jgi:phage FluMu protein Com